MNLLNTLTSLSSLTYELIVIFTSLCLASEKEVSLVPSTLSLITSPSPPALLSYGVILSLSWLLSLTLK